MFSKLADLVKFFLDVSLEVPLIRHKKTLVISDQGFYSTQSGKIN